jgi:hypothetical protein
VNDERRRGVRKAEPQEFVDLFPQSIKSHFVSPALLMMTFPLLYLSLLL